MAQGIKLLLGTGGFLGAMWYAYDRISHEISLNSSLVKQTLENLDAISSIRAATGGKCDRVVSRFRGLMAQRKGIADFEFDVQCARDVFTVSVQAHREGLNWRTKQIILSRNGQELAVERGRVPSSKFN